MLRGEATTIAVHKIVVRMYNFVNKDSIALYTVLSRSTVERILKFYDKHGTAKPAQDELALEVKEGQR
jgi:hypothetical protein